MADTYFDILAASTKDLSVGVRKAAIKILWEACVLAPQYPRSAEACCLILLRASDNEEGIQDLVSKFLHGLWLSPNGACGNVQFSFNGL